MKLYLSSYRLGNDPSKLVDLVGGSKMTAVIANSMDFLEDKSSRAQAAEREIEDLQRLGFEAEELDLMDYVGDKESLDKKLAEYGLLWVRGGNVFILNKVFRDSGFDKWLREHKKDKELVYGGYSAGVCVLAPNLKGLDLVDEISVVPEDYNDKINWEGVGLIDFAFAPHFESNHPESESITKVVAYFKENSIEYKALCDGEVIIEEI